ncbi:MAG TPA: glycerate kinase [Dinghuibacter sp.]|uniref:glycerate kinase family protein n=1 Tax=Dinghuibacter sp. TaxID=2024697 RepID=UPI002BF78A99|nr:glycerate kinase [Dinghuibacter sp.]HTJ14670.1 glycerate kinase [Dinghuibacter sp.]
MRILIAPNAFKNSLSARDAAQALQEGLTSSRLEAQSTTFPIADGGDGTADLLTDRLQATRVEVPAQDPLGRTIACGYGLAPRFAAPSDTTPAPLSSVTRPVAALASGLTALIDMASASGIRLLRPDEYDPLRATSIGTGQLLHAAISRGARQILLGVGGSATVDGGAGILHALGARFLDASGAVLSPIPAQLIHLDRIDLTQLYPLVRDTRIIVLCDVDTPLLGDRGAAPVFAPQKGASKEVISVLEQAFQRISQAAHIAGSIAPSTIAAHAASADAALAPFTGAAGGAAFGLHHFLRAELVPGANFFLEVAGFDAFLKNADLVLTGEGRLDAQSLRGKGPVVAAKRAQTMDVPVIALAGSISTEDEARLRDVFHTLIPITPGPCSPEEALAGARANLVRAARALGDTLSIAASPSR